MQWYFNENAAEDVMTKTTQPKAEEMTTEELLRNAEIDGVLAIHSMDHNKHCATLSRMRAQWLKRQFDSAKGGGCEQARR